jgi:hypothetical protein
MKQQKKRFNTSSLVDGMNERTNVAVWLNSSEGKMFSFNRKGKKRKTNELNGSEVRELASSLFFREE